MSAEKARNLILTLSCLDRAGIIARVAGLLHESGCNILESAQHTDPASGCFFLRMDMVTPDAGAVDRVRDGLQGIASEFRMQWKLRDAGYRPRVLIMVSRFGHCLNDLLYRHRMQYLNMDLVAVVSNHELWRERVESDGLPYHYLPVDKTNKAEQERKLLEIARSYEIDLLVLARYMQVLSDEVCTELRGRVINIHHSFLPSFKGARPYHQAHDRGVKLVGATAHYVTPDLDEGPIIEQDVARIDHSMTAEEIVTVGRDIECRVLATAVKYHVNHRILLNGHRTVVFR